MIFLKLYYNIETLSGVVLRKVIVKDGSTVMIENKLEDTKLYREFFIEIKERIHSAQLKALRAVNKELIGLYWGLGELIVKKQEEQGWGRAIVELLAKELQLEFPGIHGFSSRNLWNMRNFFLAYQGNTKLQLLAAEIAWTHNVMIITKCKDDLEREYYIQMTQKYGWSKVILDHQIDNKSYHKFIHNQTNFDTNLVEEYRYQAKLAVKDDYCFDFLELGNEHSEKELESHLINNIRKFLTEMGGNFAFLGSQYKVEVGGKEYYIDLLLFHRGLRALIAIELKTVDFEPEFAGKMAFYLTALDKKIRLEGENSSIGIIICKSKNRTVVEYTLQETNKPMGVATYNTVTAIPEGFKGQLPTPEEIAEHLKVFEDDK